MRKIQPVTPKQFKKTSKIEKGVFCEETQKQVASIVYPDQKQFFLDMNPTLPKHLTKTEMKSIAQKLIKKIKAQKKIIAQVGVEETSSPLKYCLEDVETVIALLKNIHKVLPVNSGGLVYKPKGTILISLPSNESVLLGILPTLYALFSSNRVIVKPSSKSPSLPWLYTKLFHEVGISSDRLIFMPLLQEQVQEFINVNPITTVLWMGSYRSARAIYQTPYNRLVEVIPESEGYDLAVVDKTANIADTVEKLIPSIITHNGRMCDSIKGIFVHKNVMKPFIKELVCGLQNIHVGNSFDATTDLSRSIAEKVQAYYLSMDAAVKKESVIFEKPFIYTAHGGHFNIRSAFGASTWVSEYGDEKVLFDMMSKNQYGLCLSIYTTSKKFKKSMIEHAVYARININANHIEVNPTDIWGGTKKSGFGGAVNWFHKFMNVTKLNMQNKNEK